jgi:hypothetical protein
MVGYMVATWNDKVRPPIKVIDTRGPKYIRLAWPFFMLNSIFQIVRYVPRQPLLHIHLAANSSTLRKLIIAHLGRLFGLDYVIHFHDPTYAAFYTGLPRWVRSFVQSMFLNASRVIVLGSPAAVTVANLLEIPSERIDIVPNAVPGPANLIRDNKEEAEPHILFLGQLQRRKGVHDLIDALSQREVVGLRWSRQLGRAFNIGSAFPDGCLKARPGPFLRLRLFWSCLHMLRKWQCRCLKEWPLVFASCVPRWGHWLRWWKTAYLLLSYRRETSRALPSRWRDASATLNCAVVSGAVHVRHIFGDTTSPIIPNGS